MIRTGFMKKHILLTTILTSLLLFLSNWQGAYPVAQAQSPFDLLNFGNIAGEKVQIVLDTSPTTNTMVINSTLSEQWNQLSSGLLDDLENKENVLDSLAWAMSKNVQQQLTAELLKWLGGEQDGQGGRVPFVQNYSDYYQGLLDKVTTDYINEAFATDTSGQCTQEETERNFLIRQELIESYAKSKQSGSIFQCGNEAEEEGSIFDRMARKISSCDTAICGQYKAKEELSLRKLQALENEKQLLDYTRGMVPSRVCQTITDINGPREVCKLVNPPFLAADATSFTLTEFPAMQLLNIDEFDEIAGNFMSNLTNQVIQSGVNALLQIGSDGSPSYVDSLANEDVTQYQSSGGATKIADAIAGEVEYNSLLQNILKAITEQEEELIVDQQESSACEDLELSNDLKQIKEESSNSVGVSTQVLTTLSEMNTQYNSSTSTVSTKSSIINSISQLRNQGLLHSQTENRAFRLTFVNQTFATALCEFKEERADCRGDTFDSADECVLSF